MYDVPTAPSPKLNFQPDLQPSDLTEPSLNRIPLFDAHLKSPHILNHDQSHPNLGLRLAQMPRRPHDQTLLGEAFLKLELSSFKVQDTYGRVLQDVWCSGSSTLKFQTITGCGVLCRLWLPGSNVHMYGFVRPSKERSLGSVRKQVLEPGGYVSPTSNHGSTNPLCPESASSGLQPDMQSMQSHLWRGILKPRNP